MRRWCGRICQGITGIRMGRPVISGVTRRVGSTRSMILISCHKLAITRSARLHGRLERTNIVCGICGGAVVGETFRNARFTTLSSYLRKPDTVTVSGSSTATPTEVLCGFTRSTPTLRLGNNMIRKATCSMTNVSRLTGVPSESRLLSGLLKDLRSPVAGFTHIVGRVTRRNKRTTPTRTTRRATASTRWYTSTSLSASDVCRRVLVRLVGGRGGGKKCLG